MENKYAHILDPNNFKIDDRELLDFIIFIKEYSKNIYFYNKKNKVDGSWYDLLKSDETFLIAEISKFNIASFSSNRLKLIQKYDEAFTLKEKKVVFTDFYNATFSLFTIINDWYKEAKKNNLTQQSSLIELEIEAVIKDKLTFVLSDFLSISSDFRKENIVAKNFTKKLVGFSSIWNLNQENLNFRDSLEDNSNDFKEPELNYAFKRITLIFNPTYEIIYSLVLKSKNLFDKSLNNNDNHKAHVGLIFAFLELIKYPLNDLNSLTKKHLDFYYQNILRLKHLPATPNKLFVSIEIDENIDVLNINKDTLLKVGQKEDGEDILFSLDNNVELNNINLSHISTFFLSENKTYDHHSRFNLISGLFTKNHASNIDEVAIFNYNKDLFSSLGEEQMFLSEEDMNMDKANIGFMIASPVFNLSKSDRTVAIDFQFTIDSIKKLSDLIIDISENKNASEETVFNEIFYDAFVLEYTSEEAWTKVENYNIISPLDWSTGVIRLSFTLDKKYPDFVNYNDSNHSLELNTDLPILKIKINQDSFYNPYSFLNDMQLNKIDIHVKVENLKSINCYVNKEEVDIKSEFEIFGATPRQGSSLIIGTDQLFNKKVKNLSLGWDYTNLNVLNTSLKEYYKLYDLDIDNTTFKVAMSALSNFKFSENVPELTFNLFNSDKTGALESTLTLNCDATNPLEIKPDYKLKDTDFEDFSNDKETGYLKLELVAPNFGFGYNIYEKVFNKVTQNALKVNPKKAISENLDFPNEPFVPLISDLYLNYEADSSLIFNQREYSENDFEQENAFYLISPFGIENTFSKKTLSRTTLVKSFNYEGELILGFDFFKPPCQINILFEILKSDNQNYEFSRQLDWYYSCVDGWKLFEKGDILFDQTMSLMKTGVLSFKMPKEVAPNNYTFNEDKIFIKACSKNKSNQFSLIRSIKTNAVSASQVLNNASNLEINTIEPNSVEGLLEPIEGVINIEQTMRSVNGTNKESDLDFYVRSSELLRHKNRPITKWDFEKFIKSKFTWLSRVKCFSTSSDNSKVNIKILCFKKIENHQNIDNIKLSAAEKFEIKSFVETLSSPFSEIEIINPVFEDLWFKCKVSFQNISNGKAIQKLHTDFFNFICSWIYNIKEEDKVGAKIKKIDIINFLSDRPYVSFITGISLIYIRKNQDGSTVVFDTASKNASNDYLETGQPWSFFIPKSNHKIDILENNEYTSPEPIDFKELGIQESFLINSDSIENSIYLKGAKVETEETATKFNFKLKF